MSPSAGVGHVLVADGEPDTRELLAQALRLVGAGVTSAADGTAALDATAARAPDRTA